MICFIINPNSGSKSNRYRSEILEILKKIPDSRTYVTAYSGHASEITNQLISENMTARIIAIGGDGTVNEIGSALLGTQISLGIIPQGSGNGLARHLGIPLGFSDALKKALHGSVIEIDTLCWNQRPFFCTAGIGFDAEVAQDFAQTAGRGFLNYIRSTLRLVKSYTTTVISMNDAPEERLFSVTIANANQYGNNAYISPNSNLQDSQFEVVKIYKSNFWQLCQLGISLFSKRINKLSFVAISGANTLELRVAVGTAYHLDGESLRTDKEVIKINIFEKKLFVVI
jgi:diacylglycerol kinase (ATP)